MNFSEAFKLMKSGKKIKLPSWGGYWAWENNTIMMHTKDGESMDIRTTKVVDYTFTNIASDEWVVADENNTPILGGTALFGFNEAIKYIKRGLKVSRNSWNGKGMHVESVTFIVSDEIKIDNVGLVIKTQEGLYNSWVPSIADLFAEDWKIVN